MPVLVGDDWKAALLWRALYDAGVFVNTALHPAVPPGGAMLRTSVMATHDEATLDRALEIFARSSASSRPSTDRCRGPGAAPERRRRTCPVVHKSRAEQKSPLLANEPSAPVDLARSCRSFQLRSA